jgi:uncharacterized cupredoxin-like copper-binding protein
MRFLVALAVVAVSSTTAAAQAVPVTLSEWKVELGRDSVHAGAVKFQIKNEGSTTHGFYVRGEGVDKGSREIPAGQSGSFTLTLKPGTYEVFCPMADLSHKKAGMTTKLHVIAAAETAPTKTPAKKPPTSEN